MEFSPVSTTTQPPPFSTSLPTSMTLKINPSVAAAPDSPPLSLSRSRSREVEGDGSLKPYGFLGRRRSLDPGSVRPGGLKTRGATVEIEGKVVLLEDKLQIMLPPPKGFAASPSAANQDLPEALADTHISETSSTPINATTDAEAGGGGVLSKMKNIFGGSSEDKKDTTDTAAAAESDSKVWPLWLQNHKPLRTIEIPLAALSNVSLNDVMAKGNRVERFECLVDVSNSKFGSMISPLVGDDEVSKLNIPYGGTITFVWKDKDIWVGKPESEVLFHRLQAALDKLNAAKFA